MALNQNKRLSPKIILADKDSLAAIRTLSPAYAPSQSAFSVANMDAKVTAMTAANEVEAQKKGEFDAARDGANASEWAFHNAVLGAKDAVVSQYGEDSDQVQAIGLKKKSERKRPTRRTPTPPTP